MRKPGKFLALVAFSWTLVRAQNVVVNSAQGPMNLTPNTTLVTFVPSAAEGVDGALKDAAISMAQDKAVAAVAGAAIPIPIVGPLVTNQVMNLLHPPKPITGFSIAFVKGFASTVAIPPGQANFRIPSQYLEGSTPALLRLKPSLKDGSRLVRSLHLSVKPNGATVTPDAHNTKLLGTEQELIASHSEVSGEEVLLTPNAPLEKGEYAVALLPAANAVATPVGVVWDFRVDATLAAAPPVAPPATVTQFVTPTPAAPTGGSVSVGQTIAAVVANLGKPERTVKFGNKDIYFFRDLKVVFVDGKVSDVQ
jgi:hypothetical protein